MQKELSSEERLEILRAADEERRWQSLDEKRLCPICHRVFNGQQVEMTQEGDSVTVRCPTPGCPSTPGVWSLVGSEAQELVPISPPLLDKEFSFFLPDGA
ncbi:hypothetical protein BH20VER3_BH20VER3_22990 [soil metagenome]